MNLIESTIEKRNEDYYVNFKEYSILIPENKCGKELLQSYVGKSIVLGIRPEHIHIEKEFIEKHKENVINTELVIHELMGAEVYLHVNCNGQKITVRTSASTVAEPGESIKVAIDAEKIHLFDKETEKTICN